MTNFSFLRENNVTAPGYIHTSDDKLVSGESAAKDKENYLDRHGEKLLLFTEPYTKYNPNFVCSLKCLCKSH